MFRMWCQDTLGCPSQQWGLEPLKVYSLGPAEEVGGGLQHTCMQSGPRFCPWTLSPS